jgi:hypothetical protein
LTGKELDFYVVGYFSRPVTSVTYIIYTVVLRDESDGSVIGEYELSGEVDPFNGFLYEGKLLVEVGGVHHFFSEDHDKLGVNVSSGG